MTRFLLDSNAASDYINRRYHVFDRARVEVSQGNPVGIAMPVLAELAAGIERTSHRDRNMQALHAAMGALKLWPFDEAAAYEYGRLYAELVSQGRPIGAIDIMIAAVARTLGSCVVVSTGSDFLSVPGLSVQNWRS
jgi:tRNA(fMet)-specific endonuclease VapC